MPPKSSQPKGVSSNYVKLNPKQGYQQKRRPGQGGSSAQDYSSKLKRDKFKKRFQQNAMWHRDRQTTYNVFDEMNVNVSLVSPDDILSSSRLNGNLANFVTDGFNDRDLHQLQNGKSKMENKTNSTSALTFDDVIIDDIVFSSKLRHGINQNVSPIKSTNKPILTLGMMNSFELDELHQLPSQILPSSESVDIPLSSKSSQFFPSNHPQVQQRYLESILQQHWGFRTFREGQLPTIQAILSGHSSLTILPTGSGKSLCYQLPAMLLPGLCLIISPLLSLMKDQLEQLPRSISAAIWSSNTTLDELSLILYRIKTNTLKLLFISPEKLLSPLFQRQLLLHLRASDDTKFSSSSLSTQTHLSTPRSGISFVCIDEVHCLSEWSHGFRPSYLQLCDIVKSIFNCDVILGLTATATQSTISDLSFKLNIPKQNIIAFPRVRSNLLLSVCKVQQNNKLTTLLSLLDSPVFKSILGNKGTVVGQTFSTLKEQKSPPRLEELEPSPLNDPLTGSVIIYCSTQAQTEYISRALKLGGYNAEHYHAGMLSFQREKIQNMFMQDQITIIVATIAFGLGINKSNIRAIIHYNHSRTIENYIQEIGRGGRDGQYCYCVTLYNEFDSVSYHSLHFGEFIEFDCIKEFMIDLSIQMMKSIRYVRATQELIGIGSPLQSTLDADMLLPTQTPTLNNPWISPHIASPLQHASLVFNQYSCNSTVFKNSMGSQHKKFVQCTPTTSISMNKRKTCSESKFDTESDTEAYLDEDLFDDSSSISTTQQIQSVKKQRDTSSSSSDTNTMLPTRFFCDFHQHDSLQPVPLKSFKLKSNLVSTPSSTFPSSIKFVPNFSVHQPKPNTHYLFTYVISPLLRSMRPSRARTLFKHALDLSIDSYSSQLSLSSPSQEDSSESVTTLQPVNEPRALHQGDDDTIDVNLIRYAPQLLTAFNEKLIKKARWKDKSLGFLYNGRQDGHHSTKSSKFSKIQQSLTPNQSSLQFQQDLDLDGGGPKNQTFTSTVTEHDVLNMYDQLNTHLNDLCQLSSTTASLPTKTSQKQKQKHQLPSNPTYFSIYLMLDSKRYSDLDIKPSIVDTIITTMSLLERPDGTSNQIDLEAKYCSLHQQTPLSKLQSASNFETIPSTYAIARITFAGYPFRILYNLYLRYCDAVFHLNRNDGDDIESTPLITQGHSSNISTATSANPTEFDDEMASIDQPATPLIPQQQYKKQKSRYTTFHQLQHTLQLYALVVETFHQNSNVSYTLSPVPPHYDASQIKVTTPKVSKIDHLTDNHNNDNELDTISNDNIAQSSSKDTKYTHNKTPNTPKSLSFHQFEKQLLDQSQFVTSGSGKYVLDIALAATRYQLHPSKILHLLSSLQNDKYIIVTPDQPSTCLRTNLLPTCLNCLIQRVFFKLYQYHKSMIVKHSLMVQLMSVSSINMLYYYEQLTQLPSSLASPPTTNHEINDVSSPLASSLLSQTSTPQQSDCDPLPYLRVAPQLKLYGLLDTLTQCFVLKEHFVKFLAPPPREKTIGVLGTILLNSNQNIELFHDKLYNDTSSMLNNHQVVHQFSDMDDEDIVAGDENDENDENNSLTFNDNLNNHDHDENAMVSPYLHNSNNDVGDDDDDDICILDSDEEIQEQQLSLALSLQQQQLQKQKQLQASSLDVWDCLSSDTDDSHHDNVINGHTTQAGESEHSEPQCSDFLPTSNLIEEDCTLMSLGIGDGFDDFDDDVDELFSFPTLTKNSKATPVPKKSLSSKANQRSKQLSDSKLHHKFRSSKYQLDDDDVYDDDVIYNDPKSISANPTTSTSIVSASSLETKSSGTLDPIVPAESQRPAMSYPLYKAFPILPHSILQILTYTYFQAIDTTPLLSILSIFSLSLSPTFFQQTLEHLLFQCSTNSSSHDDDISISGDIGSPEHLSTALLDFPSMCTKLTHLFTSSTPPPLSLSSLEFNPIQSLNHFLYQLFPFVDKTLSQHDAVQVLARRVKLLPIFTFSSTAFKQQSIYYYMYSKLILPCSKLLVTALNAPLSKHQFSIATPTPAITLLPLSEQFLQAIASPLIKLQPDLQELLVILVDYIKQTFLPTIKLQTPYFFSILPPIIINYTSSSNIDLNTTSIPLHIHQNHNLINEMPPFSTKLIRNIYNHIAHLSTQAEVPFELLQLFGPYHNISSLHKLQDQSLSKPTLSISTSTISSQITPSQSYYKSLFPTHYLPWRLHIDQSDALPPPKEESTNINSSLSQSTTEINKQLFSSNEYDPSLAQTKRDVLRTQHRRINQLSPYEQQLLLRDLLAERSQMYLATPNRILTPYKLTSIAHGISSHSVPVDVYSNHTIWKKLRHINTIVIAQLFSRAISMVFGEYYFTTHYYQFAQVTLDNLDGSSANVQTKTSPKSKLSTALVPSKLLGPFDENTDEVYQQFLTNEAKLNFDDTIQPRDLLFALPGCAVSLGAYNMMHSSTFDEYDEVPQSLSNPFDDY